MPITSEAWKPYERGITSFIASMRSITALAAAAPSG